MWTKRELVLQAFGELALYGYEFELTPEEMQTGLVKMDAMMAEWQVRGINLGYTLPATQTGSDLDEDSGIPDYAYSATYTNLAIRLASGFGKAVPQELRVTAKQGMDPLFTMAAYPQQQQFRASVPLGAGNKYWAATGRRFVRPPNTSPVQVGENGDLNFLES
jgi:hypothetical protein